MTFRRAAPPPRAYFAAGHTRLPERLHTPTHPPIAKPPGPAKPTPPSRALSGPGGLALHTAVDTPSTRKPPGLRPALRPFGPCAPAPFRHFSHPLPTAQSCTVKPQGPRLQPRKGPSQPPGAAQRGHATCYPAFFSRDSVPLVPAPRVRFSGFFSYSQTPRTLFFLDFPYAPKYAPKPPGTRQRARAAQT